MHWKYRSHVNPFKGFLFSATAFVVFPLFPQLTNILIFKKRCRKFNVGDMKNIKIKKKINVYIMDEWICSVCMGVCMCVWLGYPLSDET